MFRSDHTLYLLCEFYAQRLVGGKWRCVVVRYSPDDEVCGHGSRFSGSSIQRYLGLIRSTVYEPVSERMDGQGHVLGFRVLGVSRFKRPPLEAELMTGTWR